MPEPHGTVRSPRGAPVLLVLRRALTQARLLAAVAAVVLAGAVVLGLCATLLTTAQDQALVAALARADPADVGVRAGVRLAEDATAADDAERAAADVVAAVEAAYAAFPTTTSVWAASTPLYLPALDAGELRRAYLLEGDDLADHADLSSGRWPTHAPGAPGAPGAAGAPVEVALLDATARLLGVVEGSTLVLSPDPPRVGQPPVDPVTLEVVGTFVPRGGERETWEREPLEAAGYTPRSDNFPLYGPFVVAPGTLLGHRPVERLSVVSAPDLGAVDPATAASTRVAVAGLRDELDALLGDRQRALALRAPYPRTLAQIEDQQGVVASGVLVAALLATALAGAALGLTGGLVASRRAAESELLAARGAAGRRLGAHAGVEALVLAAFATAVGVPLTLVAYRAAGRLLLPGAAGGGAMPDAGVTPVVVVAVACGALALAAVLVVPALRTVPAWGSRGRRPASGFAVRAGADVVLLALAVLGYLQLRAHGVATGAAADPVLVAAPVLCLVAGAVLALRVLPRVAALAERHAARSRHLVVPLAAWDVARRRHSGAGAFLLVLASAATVFTLTGQATWSRSQQDQADAHVGADLVVAPGALTPLAEGRALAASSGGTPSAVTLRPVGLGSRAGGEASGEPARLLAVDLSGPGLQVGRPPDGSTWSEATADLVQPGTTSTLVTAGPDGVRVRVTGTVADPTPVTASPSLVLQDEWGDQAVLTGDPVPLDGRPHDVVLDVGPDGPPVADGLRVVAVRLALTVPEDAVPPSATDRTVRTEVDVEIDGASSDGATEWFGAREPGDWQVVRNAAATARSGAVGVVLTATASVSPIGLQWEGGDLLVVAGAPVESLPVVVTQALADGLGLEPGSPLSVTVGLSAVDAVVTAVVPYLPAVSAGPGVLADRSTLGRAVLGKHDLSGPTDQWWISGTQDPERAAAAVADAGLGQPVTSDGTAEQLRDGPLPRVLRLATAVLVVAGIALALVGTAAQAAAVVGARAVEVARLLGLGLSRRAVLSAFLLEHAATSLVAVLSGTVVGAAVAWLTAPLLVVSSTGGRPVPDAVVVWPGAALGAAVAVLVVGSTAVVLPVAAAAVRRAGAAHLRMDAAS